MKPATKDYLGPYVRATRKHGGGFGALLWASPTTQAARFDAISRLYPFDGAKVLDAGCGRADLLDFWIARDVRPAHYVGMEAVPALASAAKAKQHADCLIVEADFVKEPARFLAGADVIVFSGALNTLDRGTFYATLRRAYDAAGKCVVFNFLSSPSLAAVEWLTWHQPQDVLAHARGMSPRIESLADYLDGDCTVAMWK